MYDIAAELGIMIWQDMMFACAYYPSDEQFFKNVQTEITQQVSRGRISLVRGHGNSCLGIFWFMRAWRQF